ncbi:MAG: VacJ family lipoprotein [Candidatus Gastranaerophilales bacterium]|nr:VacJ family lipoprotein [Candidatus Gastranaerophilales bacterium]
MLNLFVNNACFCTFARENNHYPCLYSYFINEDKFEKINRKIFEHNLKLNNLIIKKVHILWASVVPKFAINSLNLAYSNIEYPKRLVSSLLQRDFEAIRHETKRFIINSTLGLAGLIDVADKLFKLKLYDEDMEQALAKCKAKCGTYFVVPFLSSTSTRDIFGRLLDFALTPTTYIATPITAIIKFGLLINRTANIQPIIKMVQSNYADPYDIARKFFGVEKHIKLSNYDRRNIIENIKDDFDEEVELVDNKEKLEVKGKVQNGENLILNDFKDKDLKADIILTDYNPQFPILDSMRTALLMLKNDKKEFWSEISIWNRNFNKKIKTDKIELTKDRAKYNFKYILQKNKKSPLAIIFPSIGEGINNTHSSIMAKIFYDEGYSVIIIGSHFQWEFLKSLQKGYRIGDIRKDIKEVNRLINNIIAYLSKKYDRVFLERTAFGTSLGAYSILFLANEQYETQANNIDKFIAICPPSDIFFAMSKIDKVMECWKNYPDDFKEKIAITTAKVFHAFNNRAELRKNINHLPFSSYEAKIISGFIFHQKLSDLIYTTETQENENIDKKLVYEKIYNSNYESYIKNYVLKNDKLEEEALIKTSNLNSISNYLINKDNYKIFHSLDDYLTNKSQLSELKGFCDDKLVLFNNGAHLGFVYRDEFLNLFKKEIKLTNKASNS